MPKFKLLLKNYQQENVGPHQRKDIQHPRANEKPQQDDKRSKIAFRIKPHTCQRHSDVENAVRDLYDKLDDLKYSVSCLKDKYERGERE